MQEKPKHLKHRDKAQRDYLLQPVALYPFYVILKRV